MSKTDQFLFDLINFDKEHIQPSTIKDIKPFLDNPEFEPGNIRNKSDAAGGMCEWVININKFYEVFLIVGPKQQALRDAQSELKAANDKLDKLNSMINHLEELMSGIQAEFDRAIAEKQKYQDEADKTALKIDLAHRLVAGLASEKVRWKESMITYVLLLYL